MAHDRLDLERPASERPEPAEPVPEPRPDSGPLTADRVLAVQRTAGNAAVQQMLSHSSSPLLARDRHAAPDLQRDKARAVDLVDDLENDLEDHARADRRWFSANWIDFFGSASQNPRLSWSEGIAYSTLSNTLGNAASLSVESFLKRRAAKAAAGATGAAIGSAGGPPGAALGFVLGVVIETAVGLILDGISGKNREEDRGKAQIAKKTSELIAAQEQRLQDDEDKSVAAARQRAKAMKKAAVEAKDSEAVYAIQRDAFESAAAAKKKPSPSDRSLAQTLLREWVLEHAGDEEEAAKDTNDAQWEAAKDRTFGKGESALDNRPEIWAYQCRGHFTELGFDGAAIAAPLIRAGKANEPKMIKTVHHNREVQLPGTSSKPDALIAMIEREHKKLTDAGKAAIREGRYKLGVKLDLAEADGSVYIDHWDYELSLHGPAMTSWWEQPAYKGRSASSGAYHSGKSRESNVKFSVSPD